MARIVCPKRSCRTELVDRFDEVGRIHWDCPACARQRAGLCADCPAPLGRYNSRRCKACQRKRKTMLDTKLARKRYREQEDVAKRRKASNRASHRNNREHNLARMAAYDVAHPRATDDLAKHVAKLKARAYRKRKREEREERARRSAQKQRAKVRRQQSQEQAA